MPETRFEPFLHLAGLGDDEALVAWGGFWFEQAEGCWRLVDDSRLPDIDPSGRTETVGARSAPYGHARVEVLRDGEVVARAETDAANHAWVRGLAPDTAYEYRVIVDDRPWAAGERWDWDAAAGTLAPSGRRYENRFRTFPAAEQREPVAFAVLGDFGVGILGDGADARRQARLAGTLEQLVDAGRVRLVCTVGDNVYLGTEGSVDGTGDEDDDWFSSFYQPYRYVLNRVPFLPAVGNHDSAETERSDDRGQLADNYYVEQRFRPEVEAGRASLDPGLFYRIGIGALVEFVCLDTSVANDLDGFEHYFDAPGHLAWVRDSLRPERTAPGCWRIPFSHHPPFCAGPHHGNTEGMVERLVPLFREAGVRLVLSGHEHNFQHSVVDGIHYVVSGAAGKLREEPPDGFDAAGTRAWASAGHLLLVEIEERRAVVHPVTGVGADGSLELLDARRPDGTPAELPIVIA